MLRSFEELKQLADDDDLDIDWDAATSDPDTIQEILRDLDDSERLLRIVHDMLQRNSPVWPYAEREARIEQLEESVFNLYRIRRAAQTALAMLSLIA